jgi:hypothetical protein
VPQGGEVELALEATGETGGHLGGDLSLQRQDGESWIEVGGQEVVRAIMIRLAPGGRYEWSMPIGKNDPPGRYRAGKHITDELGNRYLAVEFDVIAPS